MTLPLGSPAPRSPRSAPACAPCAAAPRAETTGPLARTFAVAAETGRTPDTRRPGAPLVTEAATREHRAQGCAVTQWDCGSHMRKLPLS